jgi:hypothetical protein
MTIKNRSVSIQPRIKPIGRFAIGWITDGKQSGSLFAPRCAKKFISRPPL